MNRCEQAGQLAGQYDSLGDHDGAEPGGHIKGYHAVLASLGLLICLFPGAFFRGDAITASDLIYCHPPWSRNMPEDVSPGSYILSDQMDQSMPQTVYLRKALGRGVLPTYTHMVQNGRPLWGVLAGPINVMPLALLTIIFGVPLGVNAYIIGKVLLGSYFFFKLVRLYGVRGSVAVIASLVFSFNSYATQNLGGTFHLQYICLPIALYGLEQLQRQRGLLWVLVLPFVLGLEVYAGYPPGTGYCMSLILAYGLFLLATGRNRLGFMGRSFVVGVLFLLLCAPVLLASRDFFYEGFDWDYRKNYWAASLPLTSIASYIMPFIHGSPFDTTNSLNWMRNATYFGAFPLLILLPSYFIARASRYKLFFTVFLVYLLCVLYNPFQFLQRVYRHLPILNASMASNQIQVHLAVLSFLFAMSLENVLAAIRPGRRSLWGYIAAAATLAIIGLWAGPLLSKVAWEHRWAVKRNIWQVGAIVASATMLVLLLREQRKVTWRIILPLFLLISLDLYIMATPWNRTMRRRAFLPQTEGIDYLQNNIGHGKVFMLENAMLANVPMAYEIPTVGGRGFFTGKTRELYRLLNSDAFAGHKTQYLFPANANTNLQSAVIDLLGIRYVVAPPGVSLADASEDVYLRQKEWNKMVEVRGDSVASQVFLAAKDGSAEVLRLRVGVGQLSENDKIQLKFIWDEGEFSTEIPAPPKGAAIAEFDLGRMVFEKGKEYEFQVRLISEGDAPLLIYSAQRVNIIRFGHATLDGERIDGVSGDLTFWLYSQLPIKKELDRKYRLVHEGDMNIWENQDYMGRAYLVSGAESVVAETALANIANPAEDLHQKAWVVDNPSGLTGYNIPAKARPDFDGVVTVAHLDEVSHRYEVSASHDALLVIGDNYHKGWRAAVNGEPVDVLRVNYDLRGVPVRAGTSVVELAYQPKALAWSLPLAACVAGGLILAMAVLGIYHLIKARQGSYRPARAG